MADDESTISLTPRQFRTIITGLVSAIVFIGGFAGSGIIRIDKFGLSDYQRLEREHAANEDLKHRDMEFRIRKDMPPALTRARIRALERAMEKIDPEFESPMGWQ